MSDEKKDTNISIACPVEPEVAAAFDAVWKARGAKNRKRFVFEWIQSVINGTDTTPVQSPVEPPASPPPTAGPVQAEPPLDIRKELAVLAFVLLSAQGRVGSSEKAREIVAMYRNGGFDGEVPS